ncbi:hypothetical protein [Bartonella rattimassiliensis]|uniref:Uncharacterized protein n=1 Tax=Bartonella rattimassiliensis 15908 TaxID=1094556 RepID=J1JS04_9HYPH|nr:hypothetical protein [Bartonella rattimassiliensis]EJF87215.1 hypothetical protein MCY_00339 [Bartonella rattimassiliensis 15908]
MLSSLQKLLTIILLLLPLIYGVKNVHAEFNLTELSLSGLTLDEQYKRIKERLQVIEKRIKFLEKTLADLTLSQIRAHNIEHDRLLQEQGDLNDERYKLSLKLGDLANKKTELAYRAHKAREYRVGEYEKKLSKTKEYLKSRSAFELGYSDTANGEIPTDHDIDEMVQLYPVFVLGCKIEENLLDSDIGDLLRKDFGWKREDFSWAKNAINSIDPKLIGHFEEIMVFSVSDFEEHIISGIKDMVMRNSSNVKVAPLLCKSTRQIYNIMLPEKRKNIMDRLRFYVTEWFK